MSGDVTLGYLKRLSRLPDGDSGDELIAGQEYSNVYFTGGVIGKDVVIEGLKAVSFEPKNYTSSHTFSIEDTMELATNTGASGEVVHTLPPAIQKLQYAVLVDAEKTVRLRASGTNIIMNVPDVSSAGGSLVVYDPTSTQVTVDGMAPAIRGKFVVVVCFITGVWTVWNIMGDWTLE